jgi:hypothetical protein
VALLSTRPADLPLPRTAVGLSFDLLALRARCEQQPTHPRPEGQESPAPYYRTLRRFWNRASERPHACQIRVRSDRPPWTAIGPNDRRQALNQALLTVDDPWGPLLDRICEPEVTGSIPVRSMAQPSRFLPNRTTETRLFPPGWSDLARRRDYAPNAAVSRAAMSAVSCASSNSCA